jgi:hypothetical protein
MGKVSRLKRLRKARAVGESALAQRVRKFSPPGVSILKDPPGFEKMSKILLDFAQPLLETAENKDQYREGLLIAIIAWNLTCLPEAERMKNLNEHVLKALGEDGASIVRLFVQRKLALYPDIQRHILDFELVDQGNGRANLNVISSFDNPEPGAAAAA